MFLLFLKNFLKNFRLLIRTLPNTLQVILNIFEFLKNQVFIEKRIFFLIEIITTININILINFY